MDSVYIMCEYYEHWWGGEQYGFNAPSEIGNPVLLK